MTTPTSDLLGRVVSYRDVFDTVTTPTYESLTGRSTSASTTAAGEVASARAFAYDTGGNVETVKFNETMVADPVYATTLSGGLGVSLNVGGSVGKGPGPSLGGSCGSCAISDPFGGLYGEAGVDMSSGMDITSPHKPYAGGGYSFGVGPS
jgi:hypothetical protein